MMRSLLPLVAAARAHSATEEQGDIEGILATLEAEPVYDFHPMRRRFTGMADTRRYYEHYVANVMPIIQGYTLHTEWIGEAGVAQEYTIRFKQEGGDPVAHRILAILTFGTERLSGERMYGSEAFFRTLIGPLWDELREIAD